ncbi:MAG: DNA-directed RNA polymerase subunit D [Candidatus Methanophagaceae archaeon]|nr:MAG: DNA-directed RNA polymerase subunit D [Methanophagales archaeon]
MKLKIAERRGEEEVRLVVSGVGTRFVNAIRRVLLAEVPKLAIDEVKIYENSSLLYDEQLALRLALIPLKCGEVGEGGRKGEEEKKGEGERKGKGERKGEESSVTLSLRAESPERVGERTVYSKELVSSEPGVGVRPALENIPIVKLISTQREISGIKTTVARQKISVDAVARLGRGREHAKWQPVTACGYKPDADENAVVLSVEGDGSLSVDEMVTEAARLMREKCERLVEELSLSEAESETESETRK